MRHQTTFFLLLSLIFVYKIYSMENSDSRSFGANLTLNEIHLRNTISKSIRINREYLEKNDAKIIATSFFISNESKIIDANLLLRLLRNIQKKYSEPSVHHLCRTQIRKINRTLTSPSTSGATK